MEKKQKIADDVAAKELDNILAEFDAEIAVEQRGVLLRAIKRGGLTYSDGVFTLRLLVPIEQENGKKLEDITITEPSVGQLKQSTVAGDEFATTINMVSAVSGIALGLIDRMKARDITLAGVVFAFFG